MTPTRSIGEQVAEIIGWKDIRDAAGDGLHLFGTAPRTGYPNMPIPNFETSVDAALIAYAVMKERGWHGEFRDRTVMGDWHVGLWHKDAVSWTYWEASPSLATAICLAIIAANGKENHG